MTKAIQQNESLNIQIVKALVQELVQEYPDTLSHGILSTVTLKPSNLLAQLLLGRSLRTPAHCSLEIKEDSLQIALWTR